jgi:hypothetical protein
MLLQLQPSLSPMQIHDMLTQSGAQFAHGIDACATIAHIAGLCTCSCAANNAAKAFDHP